MTKSLMCKGFQQFKSKEKYLSLKMIITNQNKFAKYKDSIA